MLEHARIFPGIHKTEQRSKAVGGLGGSGFIVLVLLNDWQKIQPRDQHLGNKMWADSMIFLEVRFIPSILRRLTSVTCKGGDNGALFHTQG